MMPAWARGARPPGARHQRRRHDRRRRRAMTRRQRRRTVSDHRRRSKPGIDRPPADRRARPAQPLTTFGAAAGVLEIPLADGSLAFGTVRSLSHRTASSPIVHRRAEALAAWRVRHGADRHALRHHRLRRADPRLRLPLAGDARARSRRRSTRRCAPRIDTALNRGRCGLWDWDLARGRIFWSHSMFAILGLAARDDAAELRRGQRARASRRHPSLRARRPARRCQGHARSTTPSACATPTATGCGCARAASWCSSRATAGRT